MKFFFFIDSGRHHHPRGGEGHQGDEGDRRRQPVARGGHGVLHVVVPSGIVAVRRMEVPIEGLPAAPDGRQAVLHLRAAGGCRTGGPEEG